MRTKEYDVQFNDGRLSIVRLRDGAPVVDSVEIPADAVGAAVQVLAAAETGRISASESQATKNEVPEARSSGDASDQRERLVKKSAREREPGPAPSRARKKKTVE